MPSLQPINLRVPQDDWDEFQKQLNYVIQDIYNYIDTIQGVDNKTFLPQSILLPDNFSVNFSNTGLRIFDTDGSNVLTVTVNSDLTDNRTLTLVTGDASRTITLNGDVTLNDWFDQAVKQASNVTFASAILSNLTASRLTASDAVKRIVSVADLTAWIAATYPIEVTNDGDGTLTLALAPIYAAIHVHDASAAQSIATGVGYTKITCYTDNGLSANCTPDAANDKITITKAGVYRVSCGVSFSSGTANVTWSLAAFLDGVEQDQCHLRRKAVASGDIVPGSITGFVDVTSVPVDIDLRARHDNGGSVNITVNYSNFNVEYVGPT